MTTEAFAPAKVNLTLHVTGQRADGYHLLDSIVVFADVGDRLWFAAGTALSIEVTGPFAEGVPTDRRNLVWQAAELAGWTGHITLEKNLPHGAGIGGGSSDAAAVLRSFGATQRAVQLGADVPVCLHHGPQRMRGIGERLDRLPPLPAFDILLVNAGDTVPTGPVFKGLAHKDNPSMPAVIPDFAGATNTSQMVRQDADFAAPDLPPLDVPSIPRSETSLRAMCDWLAIQRNDLALPARAFAPRIDTVLNAMGDAHLARMSGSGATCYGIYADATEAAARIASEHPDWWVARGKCLS